MALELNPSLRVLVVDAVEGGRAFARAVAPLGWEISFATGLDLVAEHVRGDRIELVVLDWCASKGGEFEAIRRFRDKSTVALVVVAEGLSDRDAARVLENGANCVIGEPSQSPLFLARCAAMMRWLRPDVESVSPNAAPLKVGPLSIDVDQRRVTVDQRVINFTHSEFLVLARLARTPGVPVSDYELVTQVLKEAFRPDTSIARVHVHRARRKLGRYGHLVQNVRPRAYRLVPDAIAMGPGHCGRAIENKAET